MSWQGFLSGILSWQGFLAGILIVAGFFRLHSRFISMAYFDLIRLYACFNGDYKSFKNKMSEWLDIWHGFCLCLVAVYF